MSDPGGVDGAGEPGLFVIWAKARGDEKAILNDLSRRFRLTGAFEVVWTPELVRRNYERFYSDLEVRGVYHEINKGAGPFIVAIVIDTDPVHELRETSRGERLVNANFHDAKIEYRDRVGHMGLHCSETAAETLRDTVMLLGRDIGQANGDGSAEPCDGKIEWDGTIERIEFDVAGADGWDSEADLLNSLNASVDYVILGAPPSGSVFGEGEDVQLLTRDYHATHTVMNATPRLGYPPSSGGRFTVVVGGERLPVGIRPLGDGFLDPTWAARCLDDRVLDERRFHRPPEPDDLAVRCYLALTRRPRLTDADRRLMRQLAVLEDDDAATDPTLSIGRTEATAVVERFLSTRGYDWVVPCDPTVPHHPGGSDRDTIARAGRRMLHGLSQGVRGFLLTRWLAARDELVFRAPALRQRVRRLMGHT